MSSEAVGFRPPSNDIVNGRISTGVGRETLLNGVCPSGNLASRLKGRALTVPVSTVFAGYVRQTSFMSSHSTMSASTSLSQSTIPTLQTLMLPFKAREISTALINIPALSQRMPSCDKLEAIVNSPKIPETASSEAFDSCFISGKSSSCLPDLFVDVTRQQMSMSVNLSNQYNDFGSHFAIPNSLINASDSLACGQSSSQSGDHVIHRDALKMAELSNCSGSTANGAEEEARPRELEPLDPASKLSEFKFLQWKNNNSLCWLDVVMVLLVGSGTLRQHLLDETICDEHLRDLTSSYDLAQKCFRQSLKLKRCELQCRMGRTVQLETSTGPIRVKADNGGSDASALIYGAKSVVTITMDALEFTPTEHEAPFDIKNIMTRDDPPTVCIDRIHIEALRLDSLAKKMLDKLRQRIFAHIQPSLECQLKQNDSALLALISLLSANKKMGEYFKVNYTSCLTCTKCKHVQKDRFVLFIHVDA